MRCERLLWAPLIFVLAACSSEISTPSTARPARDVPADPVAAAQLLASGDATLQARLAPNVDALQKHDGEFTSQGFRSGLPQHLGAALPLVGDGPVKVGVGRSESLRVTFTPEGAVARSGVVDQGRVVYEGAYDHVDVVYVAEKERVESFLLLKDDGAPRAFRWAIARGDALAEPTLEPSGSLLFGDAAGEPALRVTAPFAIDATGTRRSAALSLEDDAMRITLDADGLVFPVLLDPSIETAAWTQVATTGPALSGASMAYDSTLKRGVLFGGTSAGVFNAETWLWSGTAWSTLSPAPSPSARAEAGSAYDTSHKQTVLFGGSNASALADTWLWNGATSTWVVACTTTPCSTKVPPARSGHAMAFDAKRARVVVFGGAGSSGALLKDTWTWSGTAWANACTSAACVASAPPARRRAATAYDSTRQRVVVFGGEIGGGASADTWEWDGTVWAAKAPASSPPARKGAGAAFDVARGKVIVSGGLDAAGVTLSDVWEWNGTTWTQTAPAPSTGGLRAYAATSAFGNTMLTHGGTVAGADAHDTWSYHARGGTCTAASQCDTGFCVDGVCCESACGSGKLTDCVACSVASGGTQDGVCTNVGAGATCSDANACTRTDTCDGAGACKGANPVVCSPTTCHKAGTCNTTTGVCSIGSSVANNIACDDGNACTTSDKCTSGVCKGTVVANGTTCNDGNACTQTDTCQTGVCVGGNPIVCTPPDACHTAGVCQPVAGTCTAPIAADGTPCTDGDACTQTDSCVAGACRGTNAVTCVAADECHMPGVCNPANGACSVIAAADGKSCSDGNLCTQTDACQGGACVGSNPVVCAAADACHSPGTCDPASGACSNPAAPDGTTCDDGDLCTQSDTCQAGACQGANPVNCAAADVCHAPGTCDPATGACSAPAAPDGTACNDDNLCTQVDVCLGGACRGTTPITCTAADACHVAGACNPASGACTNPLAPDGTACSDDNACTQTDACLGGVCTGSNLVTCTASDACHVVGACNPVSGTCTNPTAPDGVTTCSDGNPCTVGDACQAGACVPGAAVPGAACGSACTDLTTDVQNCGMCGNVCVAPRTSCTSSECACPACPSGRVPDTTTCACAFPVGTICNDSGASRTPPSRLRHVIVMLMENKINAAVLGSASAPYFNRLAGKCGYSTQFQDNMFFATHLVSAPHYVAMTSGSNCNTGIGTAGTGCVVNNNDVGATHPITNPSIFDQVLSWRAYQESMPSACSGVTSGVYAAKHNPAPYYASLAVGSPSSCTQFDLPIPSVACSPTLLDTPCSAPSNLFTQDLQNDTLAEYTFITPDLNNDTHDKPVTQGDNWLETYLPLVFASAAYRRGDTAVYVMWDESSPGGAAQPNLFISPYIAPTVSSVTMNLYAVLRATEDQLGIATHLGCAGGVVPGGGACPPGSTADLRSVFNF